MDTTLKEILTYAAGIGAVLSIFIEISPIKLNPWSWIAKKIGRAINGEVLEQVAELRKEFKAHEIKNDEEHISRARTRILRFNDELLECKRHSQEHFDEILEDIDTYEKYCEGHPEYPNSKAVMAIENVKEAYKQCLKQHDFLEYQKKA